MVLALAMASFTQILMKMLGVNWKDSFNVLNDNIFNTLQNINNKDYFNEWICTGLFFMKCEALGLAMNEQKKLFAKIFASSLKNLWNKMLNYY